MKSICFAVKVFPLKTETFVVNQILAAIESGYEVSILTSRLYDVNESAQKEILVNNDIINKVIVHSYSIPRNKFKRFILTLWYWIKYGRYLFLFASGESIYSRLFILPFKFQAYNQFRNIDIFHIQFANSLPELALLKDVGFLKSKFIVTFHGYDASFKDDVEKSILQKKYKTLFEVSESVTANTPYLGERLKVLGVKDNKLNIIPMGIDTDYFKNQDVKVLPKNKVVKLLSIGRLIEFKGHKYAIETVNILKKIGYNIQYTIIGDGVLKEELETLIESLNLNQHVFLVGAQSQDKIKEALKVHHLYLMCSVADITGRCETQGVVTAEAQAMGLPVIGFNSGGVPYTIKHKETGFIVPEKNVDAFTEAIKKLITNPQLYSKMSLAARIFVANEFSIDTMQKRLNLLYEH